MNILRNAVIILATLIAMALVAWEALMLTVFSTTQEFWNAALCMEAALLMFASGLLLGRRARKSLTMGASLAFSLCGTLVLLTEFGSAQGYVARREIALPAWHFQAFTYGLISFSVLPVFMLFKKKSNRVAGSD